MKQFLSGILCFLLSMTHAFAQDKGKTDIIYKINGEELKGEVKAIEEEAIKFVYSGESLLYTIKKEEVSKIVFASGRTEVISNGQTNAALPKANPAAAPSDHRNKIAILPFDFLSDGQPVQDLGLKVQNECFSLLTNHSGNYKLVDNHATNALLIKAGINAQNIASYTMDEICNILGVEIVISGMVTVDKTSQTAYNSNVQNNSSQRKRESGKSNSSSYGSSYSTSAQNYSTTLVLNIYNDKGENMYGKDRKAFWNQLDAYKSTLEYLIKRSPVYQK